MRTRYCYLITFVTILLDQISKYLAVSHLEIGSPIPIIDGLVYFSLTYNPGGAFGLLPGWTQTFAVVAVIVIIAILLMVRRSSHMPVFLVVSLGLEFGGGVGNLLDRIRFGYVVDFIDLQGWPVFNIADVAITVGFFLLVYHLLVYDRVSHFRSGSTHE